MKFPTYALIAALAAAILAFFSSAPAFAIDPVSGTVQRVSDGDTLTVCGTKINAMKDCIPVRVNGLNTPEKRVCLPNDTEMKQCEPCVKGARLGVIAMGAAKRMAPAGALVNLKPIGLDRYGRLIADVTLPSGEDWAGAMIAKGYGAPYPCPGGKCVKRPRPWCPS